MTGRPRRDPRAERAARQVGLGARPRFDLAQPPGGLSGIGPSGRPRRDPRAEQAALLVPGGDRPRLARGGTGGIGPARASAPAPVARVIRMDDPACLVVVVPDLPDGRLDRLDRQVLGAARVLADAASGAVVLLGGAGTPDLMADVGPAGADRLALVDLASDDPEYRAATVCAALAALSPRHVLFPDSDDGADLARRVAAHTGQGLMTGVEVLTARQAIRPSRAGRREQISAPPMLLTLAPDRVAPYAGEAREGRPLPVDAPPVPPGAGRIRASALRAADPATMNLAEAPFVVAAGNGVTDFALFRSVVAGLHATPGASRVVCDAGSMPRAAQVGASGTVLDAVCYLAFGIAGAPQHLQGLGRVEHVVAVNTDLHAAMVARAGLSVIADAQRVMPALRDALAAEDG
ncbi:electron transfer flavoprotein subunit alpha/FixB family protein [Gluconacetobacter azotocaptans]|uniref:Electron transfer flavoprotein subunit alpha/FixB family protein n=2 Tax=Gluconacetobacter azotocaptans TaxID=142834 RepID=A0A7W4PFR3_9PROT|nr:electron transfer flavoprotein subunit alpha/FixB family protein [Gluconacetobacter azotocaptans]MBB2190844.1 electron transfer flavoprotein subunit alpha/FixB family protein [Gluconacetobacter azotocaptans]